MIILWRQNIRKCHNNVIYEHYDLVMVEYGLIQLGDMSKLAILLLIGYVCHAEVNCILNKNHASAAGQ
ncbi:hypothetical protein Tco_1486530, partial [Tanacetum coccineum]